MAATLSRWLSLAFALCALLGAHPLRADVAVPPLRTHVTDLTRTLSTQQAQTLEEKLRALEARKGSQLVVLIVPSTQPEEIEQYATRVFDTWKVGRKNVDDGAILLWAKNDRRVRIEVGRGLEGAIPDALANRILDETLLPMFREQAWFQGLDLATDQLIGLINGEALPPPPNAGDAYDAASQRQWIERYFPVLFFLPLVVFIASFWPRQREFSASLVAAGVTTAFAYKAIDLPIESLPWVGLLFFLFGLLSAFNLIPGTGFSTDRSGTWSGGGGSSWGGGGGSSAGGGASGSY